MRSLLASVRHDGGIDRVDRAVRALEDEWQRGTPALEGHWVRYDPDRTTSVLAALVKADLRCRFARREHPEVRDYLDRFPNLCDESDRVLSLIYEEFCLREEQGEHPDVDSFCRRYEPWRESLVSQLGYHRLLSRVVGATTPSPRFPKPGEHFQEFTIDSVLGEGGAARVYRARNELLGGREVALKISPDRGHEPSIMGRLDHEHIVPVHNVVFQHETRLRGLIMPYRPGLPLDKVIRRVNPSSHPPAARVLWEVVVASVPCNSWAPPSPPGWSTFPMQGTYAQGVAWIIAALARALEHAHSHQVSHRDIKPANVLLTLRNGPQLLDFNLAHDPHAAEQAEAALRGGTLPYMAPEQLEAFIDPARWEAVDHAVDLYSLGLVMHELLTGEMPEAPDPSIPLPRAIRSLLDRRADRRFAQRRLNPSIPHALEAITTRCLAYAPTDRYPSAQALADDLQQFLRRQPLRYAVNLSARERIGNWSRRHWIQLATVAVAGGIGSYTTLLALYPVERREEFRAAQAALDNPKSPDPDRAIRLLEPLVEEYPRSPLVRIHLAAAQGLVKRFDEAAAHYSRVLPLSSMTLFECRDRVPATVSRLEALGIALMRGKYWELARRALRDALVLGSTNPQALETAAFVDEKLKDYAAAREKCSACIRQIEDEKPIAPDRIDDRRVRLIERHHFRARVTIRLCQERLARGTRAPRNTEEVRKLLDEASDDLEQSKGLIKPGNPRLIVNNSLRAEVEITRGNLDLQERRYDAAQLHCEQVEKLLRSLEHERLEYNRLAPELAELSRRIKAGPIQNLTQAR